MDTLVDVRFSAWQPLLRLAVQLGFPFVGALLCCASLLYAWHLGSYSKHKAGKLPPGSVGLPLLGETLHFLFSKGPIGTPQPFFSSRLRRYGTVFKTHLLGRPTVVSMDPELSKFLLANEDKLVKVYLPHFITKLLGPTVCLQGASHRAFRELANLSVNSNAIQRQHLDAVQEHYLACLRSWHQGPSSPAVVEAQQQCREWAFTYSVKYFLGLEHDDPITAALMQDFFLLLDGVASIPINLPGTTFNKALKVVVYCPHVLLLRTTSLCHLYLKSFQ
ncbi:hypothetical protein GOP47_0030611 [Adiantum capillus-veneris]|nr:hypothetical protein GOP47_0030611 [Adiantum capillus-veneris]